MPVQGEDAAAGGLVEHDGLHRTAALAPPGSTISLERDEAHAVLDELLQLPALVERVDSDLRDLAARSRASR